MAAMNRNLQPRHLAQVMRDGFCLSALFCAQSAIGSDHVDQRDDGRFHFSANFMKRSAFVTPIAARSCDTPAPSCRGLLGAKHGHPASLEPRHAADHRDRRRNCDRRESAEIGKDSLDIVQRMRFYGMARQFGALHGVNFRKSVGVAPRTRCCNPSSCFSASWLSPAAPAVARSAARPCSSECALKRRP